MSLTDLVRKAKNGLVVGLMSAALYAGSLGLIQPVYSQQPPERLTQQGSDFYKDPKKEFEFYRNTYINLAEDGVIDSKDVETLEYALRNTIEEINPKVYNKHGALKDDFPADEKGMEYVKFLETKKRDLEELRAHLELKKEWLESKAVKGDFWNYGTGSVMYGGDADNGNIDRTQGLMLSRGVYAIGLEGIFSEFFYKHVSKKSVEKGVYNNVRVSPLSEEFPAKTKFDYFLGLLGGLAIPGIMAGSGLVRKKLRGKKLDGSDVGKAFGFTAGMSLPTFLFLDSIHPIVYPTRLAIPVIYEVAQWLFGKKDYTESGSSDSSGSTNRKDTKEKVPDLPTDFIDPWSIDVRGKEGDK